MSALATHMQFGCMQEKSHDHLTWKDQRVPGAIDPIGNK